MFILVSAFDLYMLAYQSYNEDFLFDVMKTFDV